MSLAVNDAGRDYSPKTTFHNRLTSNLNYLLFSMPTALRNRHITSREENKSY